MNWLTNIMVFFIAPIYAIHSKCMHQVASEGAIFYIEDIDELKAMILSICTNLNRDSQQHTVATVMSNNKKLIEQEQDDLRDWITEEVDRAFKQKKGKK